MRRRAFDETLINKAAEFARAKHERQERKYTGEPYIVHPERVAATVRERKYATTDMIVASWLHDVKEDCGVGLEEIYRLFGAPVMYMVDGLSKQKGMSKMQYYETLPGKGEEVCRIKLADRLDNVSGLHLPVVDKDFRAYYIKDTRRLLGYIYGYDTEIGDRITAELHRASKA